MSFIGWYNLKRLVRFIEYNPEQTPDPGLLQRLKAVDSDEKLKISKQPSTSEILRYINAHLFITKTTEMLHDNLRGIRDDFYTQYGGFHPGTGLVLDHYARVESFLPYNFIIFNNFFEFKELTELFIEALFASHACHPDLGGRLLYFDDYTLNKIILHGEHEFIKKCAFRYPSDELRYQANGEKDDGFMDWAENMLTDTKTILENYLKITGAGYFMRNHFQKMILNIITLGSLIALDKVSLNRLADLITRFASDQDIIHFKFVRDAIEYFISKKTKDLSEEHLRGFLLLGIRNHEYHDSNYIHAVCIFLTNRKIKLQVTPSDLEEIENNFIGECPKCHVSHTLDMPGVISERIDSPKDKKHVSEKIELYVKNSPNILDYVNAILYELIKPSKTGNAEYLEYIYGILNADPLPRRSYRENYYSDPRIDFFLNVWLKFGYGIPAVLSEKIKTLDPYYVWLLDPDHFNYDLFSVEWLHHYFTKFYKIYFRKSQKLKEVVSRKLKGKFEEKLSRFFFVTYTESDNG